MAIDFTQIGAGRRSRVEDDLRSLAREEQEFLRDQRMFDFIEEQRESQRQRQAATFTAPIQRNLAFAVEQGIPEHISFQQQRSAILSDPTFQSFEPEVQNAVVQQLSDLGARIGTRIEDPQERREFLRSGFFAGLDPSALPETVPEGPEPDLARAQRDVQLLARQFRFDDAIRRMQEAGARVTLQEDGQVLFEDTGQVLPVQQAVADFVSEELPVRTAEGVAPELRRAIESETARLALELNVPVEEAINRLRSGGEISNAAGIRAVQQLAAEARQADVENAIQAAALSLTPESTPEDVRLRALQINQQTGEPVERVRLRLLQTLQGAQTGPPTPTEQTQVEVEQAEVQDIATLPFPELEEQVEAYENLLDTLPREDPRIRSERLRLEAALDARQQLIEEATRDPLAASRLQGRRAFSARGMAELDRLRELRRRVSGSIFGLTGFGSALEENRARRAAEQRARQEEAEALLDRLSGVE